MNLHPVLTKILAHKKEEVAHLKKIFDVSYLLESARKNTDKRSLYDAITKTKDKPAIIAEVKRSSPSVMLKPTNFDPVVIAEGYETAGAVAISVLTDARFFAGASSYVPMIRSAVSIPVLRREFIIDKWQVAETAALGADAILLMAVNFMNEPETLAELYELAVGFGLTPLMEIHSQREWEMIKPLDPKVIGINNRDFLSPDLKVDINATVNLAPLLPPTSAIVSESGISSAEQIDFLRKHGANAFLIGSAFMKENDPPEALSGILRGA